VEKGLLLKSVSTWSEIEWAILFEFFLDIFNEFGLIKKEFPYFCIPLGEIP
jgi:hypothetical protein